MDKPNILLIMVDQMRGDCFGAAGHPDVKTPYIDTLAARGVRFTDAYTACPTCIPARAALFTGLEQRSHGRVGYQDGVDWNYETTLAGELSKAGYYTQCVGKMHVHPLRSLMGFHNVELHDGTLPYYKGRAVPYGETQMIADDYIYWLKEEKGISADVTDTGAEWNSWVARPWIHEEKYHPTNWVTARSIDFLRRRDTRKPFFLMASYVRPHPPFDAPQCYFDMYRDKPLRAPALGDWADAGDLEKWGRVFDSDTGPLDTEMIRQAQAGYYACITHLDHQIGRLLMEFGDQGLADNTVILFTSDHGELLCDHRLYRKGRPYQGSIHIPMILSGPQKLIGARNKTSGALAELRDVMPTLLDFAGYGTQSALEGVSLRRAATEPDFTPREYLHGEHFWGERSHHFIVTKTDKYIWHSQTGIEQYFDLAADPREEKNLIKSKAKADRIAYLKAKLILELKWREEGFTDGAQLFVGRPLKTYLSTVNHGK